MTTVVYVLIGALFVLAFMLVFGAAKLERRQQDWEWLHPPEDAPLSCGTSPRQAGETGSSPSVAAATSPQQAGATGEKG